MPWYRPIANCLTTLTTFTPSCACPAMISATTGCAATTRNIISRLSQWGEAHAAGLRGREAPWFLEQEKSLASRGHKAEPYATVRNQRGSLLEVGQRGVAPTRWRTSFSFSQMF